MKNLEVIKEEKVFDKNFKMYGTIEEPLFLAKDVAEWIEYTKREDGSYNVTKMLSMVSSKNKILKSLYVTNCNGIEITREIKKWFLSEFGFYEVMLRSRKEKVKKFQERVFKILKELRLKGYVDLKNNH